MGLKPIYNHSDMWNCWYEYNDSLPIYFAFIMCDTNFWCAVTLVCIYVWMRLVWIGSKGFGRKRNFMTGGVVPNFIGCVARTRKDAVSLVLPKAPCSLCGLPAVNQDSWCLAILGRT